MSALYKACQQGREDDVISIIALTKNRMSILDTAERSTGWTPLFVASIEGHLPIVRILLEAGSKYGSFDLAGWTEKEHAVYRGHMNIAKLLLSYEMRGFKPQASGQGLQGPVAHENPLERILEDQKELALPSRLPENILSPQPTKNPHSYILVALGPSNIRSSLEAIDLNIHHTASPSEKESGYNISIRAAGMSSTVSHRLPLPIKGNMINTPLVFATEDPENASLIFSISQVQSPGSDESVEIGTGVALLASLRNTLAPKQDSLIRDHTIPILENGSMAFMGKLTFTFLIIKPFHPLVAPLIQAIIWILEKKADRLKLSVIEALAQIQLGVQICRLERIPSSHSFRRTNLERRVSNSTFS